MMNRRSWIVVALLLSGCKGPPAELSVSSAEVSDGQHGKYDLVVSDADHHPLLPDGKLGVVYVDDTTQAERCRGEGVADPKNAWGDQHTVQVSITLDHVCTPAPQGKTHATFVFTPAQGAPVTLKDSSMTGLGSWDSMQDVQAKTEAAADPLVPKLEADVKRVAAVLPLVPEVGTAKDQRPCDPSLRAAFQADPPATLLYAELQWIAGEHPHEDTRGYSWASEGCYPVIASYRDHLRTVATSACQDTWKPAKYLEVYRVSGFEKPQVVPGTNTFKGGNLWGELFLIDVDAHKLLCRVLLDAGTGDKVWTSKAHDDFEKDALLQLRDSWEARRELAEKSIVGIALPHAK